jgi:hypothetical protein
MTRRGSEGSPELSQFTKNRFFKGKLMTPSIMESAREYHSDRLHTLNRYIDGTGIVHGLGIESIEETADGLEVTIEPGIALDGLGRPIVVEQRTTKSLPDVSSEELHLFVQYDEVPVETVPVPDTDGAIEADAVPNRLVESFELTHRETAPDTRAQTPEFDLSTVDIEGADPETLREQLAAQYHQQNRTSPERTPDPAVYLGAFERTHDGSWTDASAAPPRQHVHDHDMLFTLLVEHIADKENPHETPVHEPIDPRPDDLDALNERVAAVEANIEEIEAQRDSFMEYTLRKTIKDRARFFRSLSDRLERPSGTGSRLAREIARMSTDEFVATEGMVAAYRQQLSTILDHLIQVGDELEGVVPEESLERYLVAVSDLQSTLDSEAELLDLIKADNQACETADSLEVLVDVVPDA